MKNLMGVSIGGMAGLGAMGAMSKVPGMPDEAKSVIPIASVGVQIGTIGAMVGVAKDILPKDKKKKQTLKWR